MLDAIAKLENEGIAKLEDEAAGLSVPASVRLQNTQLCSVYLSIYTDGCFQFYSHGEIRIGSDTIDTTPTEQPE